VTESGHPLFGAQPDEHGAEPFEVRRVGIGTDVDAAGGVAVAVQLGGEAADEHVVDVFAFERGKDGRRSQRQPFGDVEPGGGGVGGHPPPPFPSAVRQSARWTSRPATRRPLGSRSSRASCSPPAAGASASR
jgi:hypothetical protein